SNFMGETVFQTDHYYERSFSNVFGDDHSYGASINFPNEPWGARFRFKEVGENFRPALGFANRTGIRAYEGRLVNRNRFRDRRLRQAVYSAEVELITGLDNLPQSWEGQYQAEFETPQNDRISLRIYDYFERIPEEFTVADTVPIFEGDYGWTNYGVRLQSSGGRSVQAGAEFQCCRFYNGDGFELQAGVTWRPSRYFELQPEYEGTFIRLPTGSVDIHILTLDSLVNFTPDMQLAVEVQWDNITEGFTFSGRFLWEYSPGNELFVGLGQTAIIPTNFMRFEPQTSLFSVRLGQTFQF
ncbi:MAG: hypothetical protein V3S07_09215, partial [Micropepsaceae bacterium]